jgi:hypothetical protein
MNEMLNQDGDLIVAPCARDNALRVANDNIPAELLPLAAAIGRAHYMHPANDNMPPVVAFTGLAGAGKSTATKYLVEQHGYTLVKFAGPLKDMLRAIGLGEGDIEGADKELSNSLLCDKSPRHAMQTLGERWGRECIGEDFWINLWRDSVDRIVSAAGRVVCDDLRYPNEAKAIRRLGGDIYKIEGRGGIAGGHVSEKGCGDEDLTVANTGSVDELYGKIEEALRRYG